MSFLPSNIRTLRKERKLTQQQLGDKLGLKRAVVGTYEEGRAEPKLVTLQLMADFFQISIDDLLRSDLSKGNKRATDISGRKLRVLPVQVNMQDSEEMATLVPNKASAGYLQGLHDTSFIEQLPSFRMPFPELSPNKTYRIFQIEGESMLPIPPGAYIICEFLQDWRNIVNDKPYVVVTLNEGIVFKRLISRLSEQDELLLKSDNPEFPPYNLSSDELIEIWEAKAYTSFKLPDASAQMLNLQEVSTALKEIKSEIERLGKS